MPRYDYSCIECDQTTEIEHGMNDTPTVPCPQCGYAMTKVYSAPGIHFKGSGWGGQ